MARIVTITVALPDDYDAEPLLHRFEETLVGIKEGASELETVPDDVQCPSMEYLIRESSFDGSVEDLVDTDRWQSGEG